MGKEMISDKIRIVEKIEENRGFGKFVLPERRKVYRSIRNLMAAAAIGMTACAMTGCENADSFDSMSGILVGSGSYFDHYESEVAGEKYRAAGVVHQSGDSNAVLVYVKAGEKMKITVEGEMRQRKGEIRLVYEDPDGIVTTLADSHEMVDRFPVETDVELEEGIGCLRFEGDEAVFHFELAFGGANSDMLEYFTELSPEEAQEELALEISPDSDYGETPLPEELPEDEPLEKDTSRGALLGSFNGTLAEVTKPCIVMKLKFEEPTEVIVQTDISASQREDKAVKIGRFSLICEGDNDTFVTLLSHDETDFAMGGFRWENHDSRKLVLPTGESEIILSRVDGKNYTLDLNVQVFESK